MEKAISIKELADMWTVSQDTIRRLIRTGKLKAFKVGKDIRITLSEISRFENI